MSTRAILASSIAVLALVTAGCASKSSGGAGGGGGGGSTPPATSGTHAVTVSAQGSSLVNGSGMTLYANTVDTAAKISCVGACASTWPPLIGPASAGAGVDASKLGTVKRPDGTTQVTYAGHPLYLFGKDTVMGDMKGEGMADGGGMWHAATVSGVPAGGASSPASAPASAPATDGSSTGYTY